MISRRTLARLAAGAGLAAALGLAGCQKADVTPGAPPKVLVFSVLAPENQPSLEVAWTPILADMEKQIGIPVKAYYGSNYTTLIEALRFKQTDAGWFSNLSGLEAVRRGGGQVFVRTTDALGDDGYKSVLIVPADSKTTLDDVLKCDKTLDFGIGDAKSTSGTLAPMTFLFAPRNIDPQTCFKSVRSANHGANLAAVARHVLDVGTNNTTAIRLQRAREASDPKMSRVASEVRVIWESPRLPEDPIIWRKDLDPAVKEKLRQFFLTYGQGEGPVAERQRKLLALMSIGGFKPSDNSHLLPVREMEAVEMLQVARNKGDARAIAAAQKALDAIRTERAVLESKTGQPIS